MLGLGEAAAALAAFERGLLLCAQGGEQRTEEGLRDGAAEAQRALQRRLWIGLGLRLGKG